MAQKSKCNKARYRLRKHFIVFTIFTMLCYGIINNDVFLLKYLQLSFSVVPLNHNNKPIGYPDGNCNPKYSLKDGSVVWRLHKI